MTATALPLITVKDTNPTLPIAALGLDFVFTAADVANGNSFVSTGREVVIATNTDGSSHTITVTSVPDSSNRTGDITSYAVGAGLFSVLPFFNYAGWRQVAGTILVSATHAGVKFAVLKLPR